MEILLSIIIGLVFGSVPTAYILLKKMKIDITKNGSGNIGAYNAFRITKSKIIGLVIFLIDALKGAAVIYLVNLIYPNDFRLLIFSTIALVIGHCYSILVKFKGGKGLAPAFGATIFFIPAVPIVWLVFWVISYLFKRSIDYANIFASILLIAILFYNDEIMNSYSLHKSETELFFSVSVSIMILVILSKHVNEIKNMFQKSEGEDE